MNTCIRGLLASLLLLTFSGCTTAPLVEAPQQCPAPPKPLPVPAECSVAEFTSFPPYLTSVPPWVSALPAGKQIDALVDLKAVDAGQRYIPLRTLSIHCAKEFAARAQTP